MSADKDILNNRQAYHEYHILDKFEAGAVLVGTEVKSIMAGRIQLKESYVSIKEGEVWLMGAHISQYSHGNINNHEPLRSRKLLLATGVRDILPDIPGFDELYGRSIHHCPYCDGWEVRDRPLAVLGNIAAQALEILYLHL